MDPRREQMNRYIIEESIEQFRSCERAPNESVGQFVGYLTTLYTNAKLGGITEVEAVRRLISQLPFQWREWAEHLRSEICRRDPVTDAEVIDFSMFVHMIFTKWMMLGSPTQNDSVETPTPPLACRNDFEAGPSRVRIQRETSPPGFEQQENVTTPTPQVGNGRGPTRKARMKTIAPTDRLRIDINVEASGDSDSDGSHYGSFQDSS